jgi:hypothetical protein
MRRLEYGKVLQVRGERRGEPFASVVHRKRKHTFVALCVAEREEETRGGSQFEPQSLE